MIRKVFAFAVVALMAGVLFAQAKSVKITGNLIDNACAGKLASGKDSADKIKGHSTSCALMPNCESSGYAVYADGKLYKFDDAGNKSAVEILKNTETKKGVRVEVEGTVSGDKINVTKITEVASTE
jgi:hypothetical protein